MANIKITDLTAYTDAASADVLPIVDVGADVTKKITIGNVVKAVPLGTAALPGLAFDGDPNTGIYSPGADQVAISTNGTGRLFISDDGKIGIGVSDPSSYSISADDLVIASPGGGNTGIQINITDNTGSSNIWFGDSDGEGRGQITYAHGTSDSMGFWVGGAQNLALYATGALAHVGGGSTISPAVSFNGSAPVDSLVVNSSGNVSTAGTMTADSFIPTSSTVPTNGVYLPSANNVAISTNGTGRLFVDASGNVGVGATPQINSGKAVYVYDTSVARIELRNDTSGLTATDGGFLSLFGNDLFLGTRESGYIAVSTASTERLRITSDGKLGLGTSTPSALLHAKGKLYVDATVADDVAANIVNSSATGYGFRTQGGGGTERYIAAFNDKDANLALIIDDSRRVGIGTTTPSLSGSNRNAVTINAPTGQLSILELAVNNY